MSDQLRKRLEGLRGRITAYLVAGGLFNSETALHERVRDLLIDCRAALEAGLREKDYRDIAETALEEAVKDCKVPEGYNPAQIMRIIAGSRLNAKRIYELEAELARTGPPPACHAMITPETSCELPKGHSGEHSGATPEPPAPDSLRTWITGAQFMVTPKEAPDGDAPLHVVTVEGVLKWLDEEAEKLKRWL